MVNWLLAYPWAIRKISIILSNRHIKATFFQLAITVQCHNTWTNLITRNTPSDIFVVITWTGILIISRGQKSLDNKETCKQKQPPSFVLTDHSERFFSILFIALPMRAHNGFQNIHHCSKFCRSQLVAFFSPCNHPRTINRNALV